MLLQYSYDNGMSVIKLLKENKIASLNVIQKGDITAIEYTLIADLSPSEKERSLNILKESLTERLYLTKLLNDFVISRAVGRSVQLEVTFNTVRTKKLEFYHHLVGDMIYSNSDNTEYERAMHCIDTLEDILTHFGSLDQQLPNVYHKVSNGRSRKYYPLTFKDIFNYIRRVVEK